MNLEIVNQFFYHQNPWNYIWNRHSWNTKFTKIIPERSNFQVPFLSPSFFHHGERSTSLGVSNSREIQEITFTMGPYRLVTAHKFSHFRPLKKWGANSQKETIVSIVFQVRQIFRGEIAVNFRGCFWVEAEITPLKKGADFEGHSHGAQAFPAVKKGLRLITEVGPILWY